MIVMVYGKKACREFLVNRMRDGRGSVVIPSQELEISASVSLSFKWRDDGCIAICENGSSFVENGTKQSIAEIRSGKIYCLKTDRGDLLNMIFSPESVSFPTPKKFILSPTLPPSIGRSIDNLIYAGSNLLSDFHARLVFSEKKWFLEDLGGRGAYLNGKRVKGRVKLSFGDTVSFFGLVLVYFGTVFAVSSSFFEVSTSKKLTPYNTEKNQFSAFGSGTEQKLFNRSPRYMQKPIEGKLKIEPVNPPDETESKSLFQTVGRSLFMIIPMLLGCGMMAAASMMNGGRGGFMALGIITAVSSGVIGAFWALVSVRNEDERQYEKAKKRFDSYANYLIKVNKKLTGIYRKNYEILHTNYPNAQKCVSYNEKSSALWSRNPEQEDMLFVRLGIGNIPFQYEVETTVKEFQISDEKLQQLPKTIQSEYETLDNVPVGVDLSEKRLIGIVGRGGRSNAESIARIIIAQLAANVCYTDLKIALLDKSGSSVWSFMRYLPHVWSEGRTARYFSSGAEDVGSVCEELLTVFRRRTNGEGGLAPHFLVLITDPKLLENNLLSGYLLNTKESIGVSTVIIAGDVPSLPNECEILIRTDGKNGAIENLFGSEDTISFVQDPLHESYMEPFARRLSTIKVSESRKGGEIPAAVDFLSLYGANRVGEINIAEKWQEAKPEETMAVPIGMKAGGQLCYLDIHEKNHGPHGLVAGTTGSGKSESLQSYILSLCVNFSPEDVSFFIIDYKGGGMANLFDGMPHLAGQISNLSGAQIRRAMVSLRSEINRRQRIFKEYGINSVNQYTTLYKNGYAASPVPHLLIIIDEFAELKRAEPEFMDEIISISQVGRSLGIHLILATQKPSGTVDENIRSNAKFRLCLRVQDRQDSIDMLSRPDAAYITKAGFGILQVGNDEIFEPFQGAWSGKVYDEHSSGVDSYPKLIDNSGRRYVPLNSGAGRRSSQRKEELFVSLLDSVVTGLSAERSRAGHVGSDAQLSIFENACDAVRGRDVKIKYSPTSVGNLFDLIDEHPDYTPEMLAEYISGDRQGRAVSLPTIESVTQLDAVIEQISKVSSVLGSKLPEKLWLPELPEKLVLDDVASFEGAPFAAENSRLEVNIGMVDDPGNQSQFPLSFSFRSGGNCLVLGTASSGKSTLLQTIIYAFARSASPRYINFYIIDYSSGILGAFDSLPHVGGVVTERDGEKTEKLFHLLREIVDERKRLLHGGSFTEYNEEHEEKLPVIVLAIDNYAGFRDKTDTKYDAEIMRLSREGNSFGVYLLISSVGFGMNDVPIRLGETFKTVLALELADKFKYVDAMHTTALDVLPEPGKPGRGLAKVGGRCLVFHSALMNGGENEYGRGRIAKEEFEAAKAALAGLPSAAPIPEIPQDATLLLLKENAEYKAAQSRAELIPIGYDKQTAGVYSIDLRGKYCYLVAGQSFSRREHPLKLIMDSCASKPDSRIAVFASDGRYSDILQPLGERASLIRGEEELFEYFRLLTPVFTERNKKKQAMISEGTSDEAIFEEMKAFDPVFFFIDDMPAFLNAVYHKNESVGKMSGFVENIFEKGKNHNIFFFAFMNVQDYSSCQSRKAFDSFFRDRRGMLIDTPPGNQRIFSFNREFFPGRGAAVERNVAIVQSDDDIGEALNIVLPSLT